MPASAMNPRAVGPTFPRNAPPAFHVLIKPTGAICNLDCKYSFFLSKEISAAEKATFLLQANGKATQYAQL